VLNAERFATNSRKNREKWAKSNLYLAKTHIVLPTIGMHQYPKGWHKENKEVASKSNSYAINPTKYSILCRQVHRRTKKTLGFLLKFHRFILQKVNILQSCLLAVGCTSLWPSRQRSAILALVAH
jgi:hypothetical protein